MERSLFEIEELFFSIKIGIVKWEEFNSKVFRGKNIVKGNCN